MEKYEEQLLQETMHPFKPSGHAFVCFDSISSVDACVRQFKPTTWQYVKHLMESIKDKCCCNKFGPYYAGGRNRSKSTFHRYEDLGLEALQLMYQDAVLVMTRATEPTDILWKNMKGARGLFIFRRALLFLVGLVIVFFVTSPAVILMHVQSLDQNNLLNFDWTNDLPFSGFFHQHLPPFLIIVIN